MVSADERVEHISIHALRGEGDVQLGKLLKRLADFNPRPPWGGRHLERYSVLRGHHFNPRPPWGGRQSDVGELPGDIIISIHALRGEGDTSTDSKDSNTNQFQSTPSVGRATGHLHIRPLYRSISIHALRGEGDAGFLCHSSRKAISIHALRGEGDCKNIQICNAMLVHSAYKTVYFCDSCAFYLT